MGCTGASSPTASCNEDPRAYGASAFNAQEGARVDARAVQFTFTLRTSVDEHFSAVPRLQTNLGQVVDAQVSGARLQVVLLVPAGADLQGTLSLKGDISASYADQRQRCAFERTFEVLEADSTVQVR